MRRNDAYGKPILRMPEETLRKNRVAVYMLIAAERRAFAYVTAGSSTERAGTQRAVYIIQCDATGERWRAAVGTGTTAE